MKRTPDKYDSVRRPEHSTLGGSTKLRDRDPEVFTAGVQHALDGMLSHIDNMSIDTPTRRYIVDRAADILTNVHNGQLS